MTDPTRTVPEREAQLLERLAKVFAMLADAVNELADGRPDEAEGLLEDLSAAGSFVTTSPCVDRRATDAEVTGWKKARAEQRAGNIEFLTRPSTEPNKAESGVGVYPPLQLL